MAGIKRCCRTNNILLRCEQVGGDVGGYVKRTPNFSEVLVRGAGHMVPNDQPQRAYEMINIFTGVTSGGFAN